jgi:hypothetical protein
MIDCPDETGDQVDPSSDLRKVPASPQTTALVPSVVIDRNPSKVPEFSEVQLAPSGDEMMVPFCPTAKWRPAK